MILILVLLYLSVAAAQFKNFINFNNVADLNLSVLEKALMRWDGSAIMPLGLRAQHRDANDTLCNAQLEAFFSALQNISNPTSFWALQMIDAWGKIPSGIFFGDTMELGNFDECMEVESPHLPDVGIIEGQYCFATFQLDMPQFNAKNPMQARMLPQEPGKMGFGIGTCLPETCTVEFLNNFANQTFNNSLKDNLFADIYCTKSKEMPYETVDYIAIAIFSIIGLLMLGSTIYDVIISYFKKTPNQLLVSFSVVTNSSKLFKINNQRSADVMDCLHGIRCLSIVWVLFGHVYTVFFYQPLTNKVDIMPWLDNYFSMFIVEATVSVDSFFVISGLLVAWNVFKELEKSGKINILVMYLHRYLRLTPVLAAAVLFSASLIKHVGSGPFWKLSASQTETCIKHWWSALLYVQNYVNPKEICVPHSWYLSVDTQLFFLSPLILLPLWKWGKKALWTIPVLIFLSIGCTFAQFMIKDLSIYILSFATDQNGAMTTTYYPTHTRMGPWLLGVALGYYLFINRKKRFSIPKYFVVLGWAASIGLMLTIILGPYHVQKIDNRPTTLESAFYESLSRVSWAVALCWVIFACTKGYGGLINDFLSNPLWQPFSRLQYSVYISHLLIETIVLAMIRTKDYFTDFTTVLHFWKIFGVTICVSVIMVLALESPIIGIEKVIFKRETKSPARSVTESQVTLVVDNQFNPNGNETNKF